jgi:hypothetical protein
MYLYVWLKDTASYFVIKIVNKTWKQDKRDYTEQLTQQGGDACGKGDIKSIYNITTQLWGRPSNINFPVKDKNSVNFTELEDQLGRCIKSAPFNEST